MIGRLIDRWTRRRLIRGLGAGSVAALFSSCASSRADTRIFRHGVASGDPQQDRVIIWTRITTIDSLLVSVVWELALDHRFTKIVANGTHCTGPDADFTVKIDVGSLSAGTEYNYRFRFSGEWSAVGRTKTLPAGNVASASIAVVSCSNYPSGYFNVYNAIAQRDDIDAVVHLGDYIYEYGAGGYGTEHAEELGRVPDPPHEILTLDDYRRRYAQYRTDADLQAMHRRFPLIPVWDDHETANDGWRGGAENHNADEGAWEARKTAAERAFREWLPIRDLADRDSIYRSFEFGNLASLVMLDTRMVGRDKSPPFDLKRIEYPFDFSDPDNPVAIADAEVLRGIDEEHVRRIVVPFDTSQPEPVPILDYAYIATLNGDEMPDGIEYKIDTERFRREILDDNARDLLGKTQSDWLREQLLASKRAGKTWQIIGQQVVVGSVTAPDLTGIVNANTFASASPGLKKRLDGLVALGHLKLPVNLDAWDGYPAARQRMFNDFWDYAANVVVLSGDSHSAGAFDLTDQRHPRPVGVEVAATSVTSSGLGYYLTETPREDITRRFTDCSPQMRYLNIHDQGFCVCHFTKDQARSEWYTVNTITSRDYTTKLDRVAVVSRSDRPGSRPLEMLG